MRIQETVKILANNRIQGDYFQIDFQTDKIAGLTQPGQFVHVKIPFFEHRILRRPFSIFNVDAESGVLSVIYKIVGEGTKHLASLTPGQVEADLLGPLGVGYSLLDTAKQPVIVAGGYGCAATYLLAKQSEVPCIVLIGGRSEGDLLLRDEFAALGCDVRWSTDDGSTGHKGLVTDLLAQVSDECDKELEVFACGPNPMLKAVGTMMLERGVNSELSLDHAMCCGVGGCFACVIKCKADNEDGWEYIRTCKDGPVFKADRVYWD